MPKEDRSIDILAYNIETVIAEKIETLLSRGIANSRMRDFYDLHILLKLRGQAIDAWTLTDAVTATAQRRGSSALLSEGTLILEEIFANEDLSRSWKEYQKAYNYAEDIFWEDVKKSVLYLWDMINL